MQRTFSLIFLLAYHFSGAEVWIFKGGSLGPGASPLLLNLISSTCFQGQLNYWLLPGSFFWVFQKKNPLPLCLYLISNFLLNCCAGSKFNMIGTHLCSLDHVGSHVCHTFFFQKGPGQDTWEAQIWIVTPAFPSFPTEKFRGHVETPCFGLPRSLETYMICWLRWRWSQSMHMLLGTFAVSGYMIPQPVSSRGKIVKCSQIQFQKYMETVLFQNLHP